ncbi:sure-like protein [Yamadazyma tenuis ATCC 10573]|nr:sure-like protein [Yamadazyma tenuis ATCC 10573]EGV61128.1 sure-like protein [Yamadazyma tenuis ATCC 10573]
MSNDDGFAATNIRALYRDLKADGHNVIMVAPVSQRSGWGGKFDVPYTKDLLTDGEFGYRVKGDPAWGYEPDDMNIWYFNGTPASCVSFGLEYVIPKYFSNFTVDLVVNGPNEGLNLGPGTYTGSGTIGATYNSVYHGLPAIAISASNSNNSFYKDSLDDDPTNPANINSKVSVKLIDELFKAQGDNSRVLPLGVGLNVNIPLVGSQSVNGSCTSPKFVFSRITGLDSDVSKITYNETTGLVGTTYVYEEALRTCYNGDCSLPSEAAVSQEWNCSTAVSVFQIDYDATLVLQSQVQGLLHELF